MKKIVVFITVMSLCSAAIAQFKKSSYLENSAKFADLSFSSLDFNGEQSFTILSRSPSIQLTLGVDNPEFRTASSVRIGYLGKSDYSHEFQNYGSWYIPYNYSGKTSNYATAGVGLEMRLLKQKSEKLIRFNPYLAFGADLGIKVSKYTYVGTAPDADSYRADGGKTFGSGNVGIGFLGNFTKALQVRAETNLGLSLDGDDASNPYYFRPFYRSYTVGVRYRFVKED